jgi:ketosteroid isomerase-like protein
MKGIRIGSGWKLAGSFTLLAVVLMMLSATGLKAQLPEPGKTTQGAAVQMFSDPTMNPGKALLFDLEAKFAADAAVRGGQAFIDRFADDAVSLGNGQKPIQGREALRKAMQWTAKDYQLTWTATDAMMSPSGDMGYTWGHFEGKSVDANGFAHVEKGRYMTIWRKEKSGEWKIVLDAGANEPADAGECCKVAKP